VSIVSSADRKLREFQSKPWIELAAVMFAAAGQTGDGATHAADSRKLLAAIRTAIHESRGVTSRRKWQIVTPLLIGDSQIDTGMLPLVTMWRNPPSTSTKLRENMRQLMS